MATAGADDRPVTPIVAEPIVHVATPELLALAGQPARAPLRPPAPAAAASGPANPPPAASLEQILDAGAPPARALATAQDMPTLEELADAGPPPIHSTPTPTPGPPVPPLPPGSTRLNPTGHSVQLNGPLSSAGVILGEVGFTLGADDSLHVDSPTFLQLLKQILSPAKYAELAAAIGTKAQVTPQDIRPLGYDIAYNPETISLSVVAPPGARASQSIDLAERDQAQLGGFDPPTKFSAYMTAQASVDYAWTGEQRGILDPLVLLNGAARYGPVVLESDQSIEGGQGSVFQREGTRLVYDDLQHTARWTVGDLLPTGRGFSGTSAMSGVSVYRSYETLDPQRNVQPLGNETFALAQPSTVQAYVNGLLVRQIRLNPGTYNIHDFPFTQGSNNVTLVITDDAGNRQTLNFSLFFDHSLLAPGLAEFGLYVGVLSPFKGSGPDYHFDEPVASGYYRRGITDTLTVGGNFQAQRTGGVAGIEATWASPIGTFNVNAAGSENKGFGAGYALNLGYTQIFNPKSPFNTSIAVSGQTESAGFSPPRSLLPQQAPTTTPSLLNANSPFAYQLEASISQGLWNAQYVSLDAQFSKGRAGNPNQTDVRLDYGVQLTRQIDLVVGVQYEDDPTAKGFGGLLTLVYRPNERVIVQADADTLLGEEDVGASVSSKQSGVGSWTADAEILHQEGVYGFDGDVSYESNRAELGLAQESDFNGVNGAAPQEITTLRLASALAFADGKFALSRPIFDSFAMVQPHSSLDGAQVLLDRNGSSFTAESGALGPAVEPDLTSYSERTETVDVPKAPPGYDLGSGSIRMYPPYHSGYLITVGSDYSVTAVGRLLDGEGQPVALLAGQAIELAAPTRAPIVVFTNRQGAFGLTGVRPGKWRVTMPTDPQSVYVITIPAGAKGVVRLGDERPEK